MKNIRSIVPLLPAQQLMLAATLKNNSETYVQQLLFEVKKYSSAEISEAVEKLVKVYECFRSVILYEGLKQPVFVCKDDVKAAFLIHKTQTADVVDFIRQFAFKGFDFQLEPCLRFDWIETEDKNFLCITNHHILYDGWGKQIILNDFIRLLKQPVIFLPEKLNKNWYEAWLKLNQQKALDDYKSYLGTFGDFAILNRIESEHFENLDYQTKIPLSKISELSTKLGLTAAELLNFSWSVFFAIWTQNPRIQMGVVKQNGLIGQVTNGFGIGIQTLPFQFEVDFKSNILELLKRFKQRERSISDAAYVNVADPFFNAYRVEFIIAFENYPIEHGLKQVENEFILRYSFDRSEFPLSLAVTPYPDYYNFDWHFNTKFHSKKQVSCLAAHFSDFIRSFDNYLIFRPEEIYDKLFDIPEFQPKLPADQTEFFQRIERHLEKEESELYARLCLLFSQKVNRIWIFGDKHRYTALLICAAWKSGTEVLTINEKEATDFITKLFEVKKPDFVFTSVLDNRLGTSIHLDDLNSFSMSSSNNKIENQVALSVCTSGSTGEPKVVQLSLENMVSFFEAWDRKLPWGESEVFAAIAHPAFDIGVGELIFPLWKGWKTKLIDKTILADIELLQKEMSGVTAFHMVPSLLENWIQSTLSDDKTRIIMTGGDKVPPYLEQKLHNKFPNARLFQFYGPSECSVLTSGFENNGQFESAVLPLGTNFEHAELYVFGKENLPLAPFQEGEIIVCGTAVGLGYSNAENSEKFFIYNNQKAYRTGDLGFKDSEGNLFFRGRKDNQIKINGQRIELSRIESALCQWSSIEHWVVATKDNLIYAFAKSEKPNLPPEKDKLQHWLPPYAIPHIIEYRSEFPLNKNGKVDIQLLLKSASKTDQTIAQNSDPEISALLKELFPDKTINFSLNWYANGLNSIDALKFSGLLKNKLKIAVELSKILFLNNLYELSNFKTSPKDEAEEKALVSPGMEVYSTAARILFLSESDEQFFKTYWISSGVVLPKELDIDKIKHWFSIQKSLQLAAKAKDNKYFWKVAETQIFEIAVKDETEFCATVENNFIPTEKSLLICFVGISEKENYLAFKVHHALLDGLGVEYLWKKLDSDLGSNKVSELRLLAPREEKIDKDFWEKYLSKIRLQTPVFQRLNNLSSEVGRLNFRLGQSEKAILKKICTENNCSLFEAGLILFSSHCHRHYGKDYAIGIPVNIGAYSTDNQIAAMSVNILPFRTAEERPEQILKNWRQVFERRFTPFSEIAQLDKSQKNGLPFFNCTYLYHGKTESSQGYKALSFKRLQTDYLLSLDFLEEGDDLIFSWEYKSEFFSTTAIQKIHENIFSENKKSEIKEFKQPRSLQSRWTEILDKHAFKTALIFAYKKFNYNDLNNLILDYSNNYSPPAEGIEVLVLERNEIAVAKLLYHLTRAVPFIPVDSETSADRIAQIRTLAKNINLSNPENNNLQYIIATSGSTGEPKLVGVSQTGYASAVEAWIIDYQIRAEDCCMQAASFSFDVSLGDIGRCFFNGAAMLLLSATERKDPTLMLQKIREFSVSVFETTPLVARWWLSDNVQLRDFPSLRLLIVGSDSWQMKDLRKLFKTKSSHQRIISSYGLSETTIDNSFFDIEKDEHFEYNDEMTVPIGKSMSHCKIEITDSEGKILEDGLEGFISISGPAVGLGYFREGKWSNYKQSQWLSADKGIIDEWGICHFRGRSDRQVKIRGQRVELEEIENILSSLQKNIRWSVVDFEHELSSEMAAFYSEKTTFDFLQIIKRQLLEKYPAYFIPSLFIEMEQLPLNINGKTDWQALRKIAASKFDQKTELIADNDLIKRLLDLYHQCFNENVRADQNFFFQGKNSFDAMQFVRNWNHIYEEKMAVQQLFSAENFTILATLISQNKTIKKSSTDFKKISKAQGAIWFEIKKGNSSLYNLPHLIEIPENYEFDKIKTAFEKTLKACPALFVRFTENDNGEVYEIPVETSDYQLAHFEVVDLNEFQEKAYLLEQNLTGGPAFEAAIISNSTKNYLYFNPHHLVYDGGSDASLRNRFEEFYLEVPEQKEQIFEVVENTTPDWKSYFKLLPVPEFYFHSADNSIQPSLILACPEEDTQKIERLTKAFQCTQSVIISFLLSNALHKVGFCIRWLSLALDHRTTDSVGMYMRAYPFPGYDEDTDVNLIISKQKWALSQLFAAAEHSVIYPENQSFENYHQVGLVIQHPFYLEHSEPETEKIEYTRPRLPLTLYVEQINDRKIFRWEYDHGQISTDQIRAIHREFFKAADVLLLKDKKIIHYRPEITVSEIQHKSENTSNELLAIWKKYIDNQKVEHNHFFEAGANSIKALLMLREIEKNMQVKISASDFFRQPTLEFLNKSISKPDQSNLIWKMKNGNTERELWLLPPIMGLSYIFNSLTMPDNLSVFAFSYPMAMGTEQGNSIEEISQLLIKERLRFGELPEEVSLLGYSMGALTAFEMAKWLQENNVKVKKLIILDKTAQPEAGKNIQSIILKSELLETARQISVDETDFQRVESYLKKHQQLIEAYQQQGFINAEIEIYYCEKGFPEADFLKWQRFSNQKINMKIIKNCSHYEIPKIWNELKFDF